MAENKSVGALWLKEGKNGKYFSGSIELIEGHKVNIVVFKNQYKEASKHPDYKIYLAREASEKTKTMAEEQRKVTDDDSDIPF